MNLHIENTSQLVSSLNKAGISIPAAGWVFLVMLNIGLGVFGPLPLMWVWFIVALTTVRYVWCIGQLLFLHKLYKRGILSKNYMEEFPNLRT